MTSAPSSPHTTATRTPERVGPGRMSRRTLLGSVALLAALTLFPISLEGAAASAAPPVTVGWSTLKTLKSDAPASQPSPARDLQGKRVAIPGFMVPLEDDADNVTEFLLVPYAGACIHVPPPPPNQIVHVLMNGGSKVKMSFVDPIVVTGTLKISTVKSPYGDVSYDLAAETVTPYTGERKPLAGSRPPPS